MQEKENGYSYPEQEPIRDSQNEINDAQDASSAPRPEATWYGVSYQSGESSYAPNYYVREVEEKRKGTKRSSKIALLAVIVAAAILLSAVAGFGGAMLAGVLGDFFNAPVSDLPSSDDETNTQLTPPTSGDISSPNGSGQTVSAYPFTDTNYDYAAAFSELQKNSDASLIGSANGSAGEAKKSLIEVTAAVKDSVVEITTTTVSNRGTISAGAGSGVIIHEDGIIVTNNHVIEGCDHIYVRLTNGDTYVAALRGTNEAGDIAILKITPQSGKPLSVAKLGYSRALALGEEVVAIGNPLGELGGTVTNGIISATEREVTVEGNVMMLLQTNAAINSGNSGGGLFNLAGELVGVVNAKYSASGVEGLGFAIPIDLAYEESFSDLLQYGYIRGIPSIGITLVDSRVGYYQMQAVYGAYVYDANGVEGFQEGDYIYSFDGKQVYGMTTSPVDALRTLIRQKAVGDVVSIKLKRGNSYVTLSVTVTEYVPDNANLNIQE